jgi:hypothetical protein
MPVILAMQEAEIRSNAVPVWAKVPETPSQQKKLGVVVCLSLKLWQKA